MLTLIASVLTFKMINKEVINLVFLYPIIAMGCDLFIATEIIKLL